MVALTAFLFVGCDDESTDGMTRITYYPELTLMGETTVSIDKGSAYVEPGYKAVMNGEDVTADVNVSSNVDTSRSGVYSITYSIANSDGIAATASRKVVVADPAYPLEGLYLVSPDSYRDNGGTIGRYGGNYEVVILSDGAGGYNVDDLLGGWYCQRAGYGTDYSMSGNVTLNADATITMNRSYIIGWKDGLDSLEDGTFDAASGTLSWKAVYVGMEFYITMNK